MLLLISCVVTWLLLIITVCIGAGAASSIGCSQLLKEQLVTSTSAVVDSERLKPGVFKLALSKCSPPQIMMV